MPLTVADRARRIANFRYIEVRLMEIAAGWTPTTPEMEVKVMFGRHIWDFAQHADWLGKRTFELRQGEHYTLPPSEGYVELLNDVAALRPTPGRLRALYDVVLAGLDQWYAAYMAQTDGLLDEPSVVISERIRGDIVRMRRDADGVRGSLQMAAADLGDLPRRHERVSQMIEAR
jgi:hypothetical protein